MQPEQLGNMTKSQLWTIHSTRPEQTLLVTGRKTTLVPTPLPLSLATVGCYFPILSYASSLCGNLMNRYWL